MGYNYLEVITLKELTEEREGVIAIDTEIPYSPNLVIFSEGSWKIIEDSDALSRMARFDDLYTSLYYRDWCIGGRFFIGIDDKLYMTTKNYESDVPVIKNSDPLICLSESEDAKAKTEFENLFTTLLRVKSMSAEKEINLGTDYYHSLVSMRDFIDSSTTVDVYSYSENSTDYSNILNLTDTKGTYSVKLDVVYTKDGKKMSGTLLFEPGEEVFVSSINQDVTVEVKNKCIRLFPENDKVTECIIYHCCLIYEKLL